MNVLQPYLPQIESVCKEHGVTELHLFGSALREDFSEKSDIDLLVVFSRTPSTNAFHQYFDFKEALEAILSRPVDLICERAIRNPVFRDAVQHSRQTIYAA